MNNEFWRGNDVHKREEGCDLSLEGRTKGLSCSFNYLDRYSLQLSSIDGRREQMLFVFKNRCCPSSRWRVVENGVEQQAYALWHM
jgi:hypothetical protein